MAHTEFQPGAAFQPGMLLNGQFASSPRTLVDVFRDTVRSHPEASALDNGKESLSYLALYEQSLHLAEQLAEHGIGRGDRVGIRISSGTLELYIAILGTLLSGAAYVPVDADDPEERAELVFSEAKVAGVLSDDGVFTLSATKQVTTAYENAAYDTSQDDDVVDEDDISFSGSLIDLPQGLDQPDLGDDAWIIFTSGSTGVPKGVAVSHRSAAAFIDAEADLFCQGEKIGQHDRVLAGLSVAFDASCEEMWLAWRNGACLVPAPRSLVRSGVDLGPWLISHNVTVVSTVPTLAAMWPPESLENVRLLIFGGEACPPELAVRLDTEGREVWNTYGPTEATVVSCAALMDGEAPSDGSVPVRIGLPLNGWDLAVVDQEGKPVLSGESGELIIGGVGLARYLDPDKDSQVYAPFPTLGWDRAYRSGDIVTYDPEGLIFVGRIDDQVKIGGRRVELGEIDAALQALPGVSAAAAVVQKSRAGNPILVGYLAEHEPGAFDQEQALTQLRRELPTALVPLLVVIDQLPVRTSGKVDRKALPWPLPQVANGEAADSLTTPTQVWLAEQWNDVLGVPVTSPDGNFFDLGGSSLAAAQLVSRLRTRQPGFGVSSVYSHPRLAAMATLLEEESVSDDTKLQTAPIRRVPVRTQFWQTLLSVPVMALTALRWLVLALIAANILVWLTPLPFLPTTPWWLLFTGFVLFVTPFGRMGIAVVSARFLLAGVKPGNYPRGGGVHLRVWLAEKVADSIGAVHLAGAPWIAVYARALGAKIEKGVDLHTIPPITGMLTVRANASIEPEVDLSGYWIDGDTLRLGAVHIGAGSSVGARSILLPGTHIGKHAEIAPGSAVFGRVPAKQLWSGSPAARVGKAKPDWPEHRPEQKKRWVFVYGLSGVLLSALPFVGFMLGAVVIVAAAGDSATLAEFTGRGLLAVPLVTLVWFVALATFTVVLVRLLGIGIRTGYFPVRSRVGWQVWATERLLDAARTLLFPIYASSFTPTWLRLLGAKVGSAVEASTVLLLPKMTTIGDGAFLADDTMVASYELGGGWVGIDQAKIGKRAFLGNSGMTGPGRTIPKDALVAVLSATPSKAKNGSSWMGSPPVRLRRRPQESDASRTFAPPTRLRVARAAWEVTRIVPVMVSTALAFLVAVSFVALTEWGNVWAAVVLSGIVLLTAGLVAALATSAAKWLLVGRIQQGEHPLWSSFIWRNEVADTFVEMLAAPWFANLATGTPVINCWLRTLGAKIGRGVWCETYWLPEADLVELAEGATVNRGCVVQTHLFHDRIMSLDSVSFEQGATLGPHSVVLPASRLGERSTIGPSSLVMRGETVPAGSRWSGNPIGPWKEVDTAEYKAR